VNVNHNCAANGCQTAPTRQVRQERQRTDLFENEVTHAVQPNDCFLNLAQLRSATDVQQFRSVTRYPSLALAEAIEQAIHNRERLEREAKEAEELKEAERLERAGEREAKAAGRKEKAARGKQQNPRGLAMLNWGRKRPAAERNARQRMLIRILQREGRSWNIGRGLQSRAQWTRATNNIFIARPSCFCTLSL
jgi:hypothetical protein